MIVEPQFGARIRRSGKTVAWYCGQHWHDTYEESHRCWRFHYHFDNGSSYWHDKDASDEKQFNTTFYIRSRLEPEWGAYIRESLLFIAGGPGVARGAGGRNAIR